MTIWSAVARFAFKFLNSIKNISLLLVALNYWSPMKFFSQLLLKHLFHDRTTTIEPYSSHFSFSLFVADDWLLWNKILDVNKIRFCQSRTWNPISRPFAYDWKNFLFVVLAFILLEVTFSQVFKWTATTFKRHFHVAFFTFRLIFYNGFFRSLSSMGFGIDCHRTTCSCSCFSWPWIWFSLYWSSSWNNLGRILGRHHLLHHFHGQFLLQ